MPLDLLAKPDKPVNPDQIIEDAIRDERARRRRRDLILGVMQLVGALLFFVLGLLAGEFAGYLWAAAVVALLTGIAQTYRGLSGHPGRLPRVADP